MYQSTNDAIPTTPSGEPNTIIQGNIDHKMIHNQNEKKTVIYKTLFRMSEWVCLEKQIKRCIYRSGISNK